jgi:hypothetical protein
LISSSILQIFYDGPEVVRHEYEFPIPVADAEALLEQRGPGSSEVELNRADQSFARRAWLGRGGRRPRWPHIHLSPRAAALRGGIVFLQNTHFVKSRICWPLI